MKKFLALLLAALMVLGVCAFASAEDEAGFKEYDLGEEGEQDVGFMSMSMVYFQPVEMDGASYYSAAESDLHIEVDLTANENPYGFEPDSWVPYLSIDFVIYDENGAELQTGSMMPMNASDGPHYGANIALAEGNNYSIKLSIKNPAENGYLIHIDDETGVEADAFWTEPFEATWTGWNFRKEW